MSEILILLAVGFALTGVRERWPGFRHVARFWRRHRAAVWGWVRSAPVTYAYLLVLTLTTWMLGGTSARVRNVFLEQQGTDIHELDRHPVSVLVRSAFYVSPLELVLWWVAFTLVLAVVEQLVGWRRLVSVFVVGHVLATLVVAVVILWALHTHHASPSVTHEVDVGASYGFAGVAGAAVGRCRGWYRLWWVLACLAVVAACMAIAPTFTDLGHVCGVLIGFACAPVFARGAAEGRSWPAPPAALRARLSWRGRGA